MDDERFRDVARAVGRRRITAHRHIFGFVVGKVATGQTFLPVHRVSDYNHFYFLFIIFGTCIRETVTNAENITQL
jgi:hypothetical protein